MFNIFSTKSQIVFIVSGLSSLVTEVVPGLPPPIESPGWPPPIESPGCPPPIESPGCPPPIES